MTLTLLDLDNTLLAGDSDHLWGDWLCTQGLVDAANYRARNDQFHRDYNAGKLDIDAYHAFCMAILAQHDMAQLNEWHKQFMADCIEPIILPKGEELIAKHRTAGDTLLIITATNSFIAGPIARRLGVENIIATEPQICDGRYTGHRAGVPCFREGKITRLNQWLEEHDQSLDGSYFYSDSRNDLPLLEVVDRPVAVDPDDVLRAEADKKNWPIISLR